MDALNEELKLRDNIPSFILKESGIETCYHLVKLQNKIKLCDMISKDFRKNALYLSIDTETYERNHRCITEIGWVIFKRNGTIVKTKHGIVKRNLNLRNGKFVDDNKENFDFGHSDTQSLTAIVKELNRDLQRVNYIVGQGINNDIRHLSKFGAKFTKFNEKNVLKNSSKHFGIIDTLDIYTGRYLEQPIGLEKGLKKLDISYRHLHNAGNDAYYTMLYLLKLLKIRNHECKKILNIKIPDEYKEEDYFTFKENKKILKQREREARKNRENQENQEHQEHQEHQAQIQITS
ncbi:hypothetical protein BCR36DRAFT_410876 [Piromyces finnis]|uniref:Gfd2/YDR514C-like C-terminal domain-containing protein n=1 Tax=Piromyces finnis TaxID=1754191 RepID=A0A1Y1VEY6_9FUNG|nr:hypothetical protein BCR36DRAFT_410876 [Piromyces finnis]|eukprot:ORX54339.1 hypothetical protein BCR36DRAFT_410876 [Piromyces finnis]